MGFYCKSLAELASRTPHGSIFTEMFALKGCATSYSHDNISIHFLPDMKVSCCTFSHIAMQAFTFPSRSKTERSTEKQAGAALSFNHLVLEGAASAPSHKVQYFAKYARKLFSLKVETIRLFSPLEARTHHGTVVLPDLYLQALKVRRSEEE